MSDDQPVHSALIETLKIAQTEAIKIAAELVRLDGLPSDDASDYKVRVPKKVLAEIERAHKSQLVRGNRLKIGVADRIQATISSLQKAPVRESSGWKPIETAPLGVFVIAGWTDEDEHGRMFLDDTQVISLHTSKNDWKPGEKAWLNQGSGNYGTPKQSHQWPTHWMYPPAFTQIEGGKPDGI